MGAYYVGAFMKLHVAWNILLDECKEGRGE